LTRGRTELVCDQELAREISEHQASNRWSLRVGAHLLRGIGGPAFAPLLLFFHIGRCQVPTPDLCPAPGRRYRYRLYWVGGRWALGTSDPAPTRVAVSPLTLAGDSTRRVTGVAERGSDAARTLSGCGEKPRRGAGSLEVMDTAETAVYPKFCKTSVSVPDRFPARFSVRVRGHGPRGFREPLDLFEEIYARCDAPVLVRSALSASWVVAVRASESTTANPHGLVLDEDTERRLKSRGTQTQHTPSRQALLPRGGSGSGPPPAGLDGKNTYRQGVKNRAPDPLTDRGARKRTTIKRSQSGRSRPPRIPQTRRRPSPAPSS
jgi:hypothetical protein